MIKRIEKWLATIIKAELKTVETDAAGVYNHLTSEIGNLRNEIATVIRHFQEDAEARATTLKNHVASETAAAVETSKKHVELTTRDINELVAENYEDLKKHIQTEILKRYDTLVRDAASAARMMDASKIAMAICDYCHLSSRRFTTSRIDGKVVCADCAAKGQN